MNFHDEKINEESQKCENDWSVRIVRGAMLGAMLGAIMGAVSWAAIDKKFGSANLLLGTDNNTLLMGIAGFICLGFIGFILGIVISAFKANLVKSMLIGLGFGVLIQLPGCIMTFSVSSKYTNGLNTAMFIGTLFVIGLNGILVSVLLDFSFVRKQIINFEEKRTSRLTRRR